MISIDWNAPLDAPAVVAIALGSLVFGLFNMFLGYRFFRVMLGVYGVVWGSLLLSAAATNVLGQEIWVFVVFGLLGAIAGVMLAMPFYRVGIFVVGATAGGLFLGLLLAGFGVELPVWVNSLVVVASGVVVLVGKRPALIVATAWNGAWASAAGVLTLISGQILPYQLPLNPPATPGRGGWVLFLAIGIALVLAVVGATIQFRATAAVPDGPSPRMEAEMDSPASGQLS